jgi:proton-dependent oligopeptide transporter, POT family
MATSAEATLDRPVRDDAYAFLGHPRGLAYLGFTEMWERFSYYGMTALLSLYMVQQLLLPGHAEHVLGLGGLRALFEFRGPMSDLAFASLIYGWYGGLVYFTPIIGGWLADRWLGTTLAVTFGALLMAGGHLAMSFDASFLFALALLILGSGLLKGNIAAQVGELYPPDDDSRRTRGFTIFSAAINIGAVGGPIACGTVAAIYGWHFGFGLAAALMLVALATYLSGLRYLPGRKPRGRRADGAPLPPLSPEERRRTWLLVLLFALVVLTLVSYVMIWNIGILWVDERVDLSSPFGTVPASWFNSIDALGSVIAVPPLVALWAWQARRRSEPNDIAKIAIGGVLTGLSALVLAAGSALAGPDGKTNVGWAVAAYFGMGVAFLYYWPVLLALVSRVAPAKINSTMMGSAYLALFVASVLMGWVGSFYDQMSPAEFWALDAAIAFAGALIVFAVNRPLSRALEPQPTL